LTKTWIPKKTMPDAQLKARRKAMADKLQVELDAKSAANKARWDSMTEAEKQAEAKKAIDELWPG
jgi:hypothetical protein